MEAVKHFVPFYVPYQEGIQSWCKTTRCAFAVCPLPTSKSDTLNVQNVQLAEQ